MCLIQEIFFLLDRASICGKAKLGARIHLFSGRVKPFKVKARYDVSVRVSILIIRILSVYMLFI